MAIPLRPPRSDSRLRWGLWNALVAVNRAAYRATGGRIGGRTPGGAPVLLLDHVGRTSGTPRTSPLIYVADGDDLVVVASTGGGPRDPQWWLNLKANPQTTVQVGRKRRAVVARQASAEEKRQLWPRLVEVYPEYDEYEAATDRDIPVVILMTERR